MILVTYKSKMKKSELFDADSFEIVEAIPFRRRGIYIRKGDEIIAYLNNIDDVEKVEKIEGADE